MSLSPGSRLGSYTIVAKIGAGGMGEVYRATDTKLRREVAIKVLPAEFTAVPERLARFEREAQLLAQLHHPNIASIFGLEESDGHRALVLELVEGDDLAQRLERGAIPLEEALPIARQIADALETAHEQGIVHRDLKPANVKVRPDGTVKVLDFGIAKALEPVGTSSGDVASTPTLTAHGTRMGMLLGTAAYMAPEQARGKAVDRRADIWAFGAVLYEMLTGRRAFEGDDVSVTVASVLKDDPDWQALPADLPASLRRLLRRCLEKDPRRRLSSIGDARLELDEREPPLATVAPPGRRPLGSRLSLPLAAAIALVSILVTAGLMRVLRTSVSPRATSVTRLSVALPDGDLLAETNRIPLALSPDGSVLAYAGQSGGKRLLFLRKLSESEPRGIPGTENAVSPFFSPDGKWIAFFGQQKLRKVAVDGAGLQVVCDGVPDSRGGTWALDGTIYFAPTNSAALWRVAASGGTAAEFTRLDHAQGEISHRWPHVLPDGKTLLFTIWTGPGRDESRIAAQSIATGERHVLMPGGDTPRWLPSGYLVYTRRDDLFAVPWQPSQKSLAGAAPATLPEHPRTENEGAAACALSANGTLAYVAGGPARYAQRLVWVDRSGSVEALVAPERDYESVAISPDGRRVVVQVAEGTTELWMYDFGRRTLTPFVTSGGSSQAPLWTRDGRYVVYRATRAGTRNLFRKSADGSGEEERLTTFEGVTQTPTSFSPDGRWLLFNEIGGPSRRLTIHRLQPDGDRTAQPLLDASSPGFNGQVSPDGRWLAYHVESSGRTEIAVRSFPGPGPMVQVSNGGGTEPRWGPNGRELFFEADGKLMVVDLQAGSEFSASDPRVLFVGEYRTQINGNTAYDVSPDGRHFLRIQAVQPERPLDRIEIVLNWGDELKRMAGAK